MASNDMFPEDYNLWVSERQLPIEGTRLEKAEGVMRNDYVGPEDREFTDNLDEAHLVTSIVTKAPSRHKLVLDIDFPAKLLPSSTEGHFHLFIDKEISWSAYDEILRAFGRAGLLEDGYVGASLERGYTAVRLPWIKKPTKTEPEEIHF